MKRSGYLKRKAPLVARRTLKRKPMVRRARRPKPGDDPAYRAKVRLLPCVAALLSGCIGAVDAHHAGERPGVALKAPDRTCIPLCRGHHDRLHDSAHPFKEWGRERKREWSDEQVRCTQERLDAPPFDAEQDRVDEAAEAWAIGGVQCE